MNTRSGVIITKLNVKTLRVFDLQRAIFREYDCVRTNISYFKAACTQVTDIFGIILISEIFKRIVFTFKH